VAGVRVAIEAGTKRVFASALDWPGWCRSGKSEQLAIEALAAYGERYAAVAKAAAISFPKQPAAGLTIVERLRGDATTDFGAPSAQAKLEAQSMTKAEVERMCALVSATWTVLDRVVKGAPPELRKGPRGGGRDRDKIVDHVLSAECGYAPKLGLKLVEPPRGDRAAISAHRQALLDAFRKGADGKPVREGARSARYWARRIAWHAMDHAWEIEDRTDG
jgi:hypothetical protein